jgi:hypothetical protein
VRHGAFVDGTVRQIKEFLQEADGDVTRAGAAGFYGTGTEEDADIPEVSRPVSLKLAFALLDRHADLMKRSLAMCDPPT